VLLGILLISVAATAQDQKASKTKITFYTWAGGSEVDMLKAKIARFMFINPDIEVLFNAMPYDEYEAKLLSMHAGGKPPDVAYYSQLMHKSFYDKNLLEDLWPSVKDDKAWIGDYRPFLVKIHTFGGKYVGTSLGGWGCSMLFYNVDMFKQNGIAKPPSTWNEFKTIAKKLTKDTNGDGKTDVYGGQLDGSWETFEGTIRTFGGDVMNEDGSKCLLTGSSAIEGVQFWADMLLKDKILTPWVGTPGGVGFAYGNVGMSVAGIWSNGFWTETIGKKFQFDIAPIPGKKANTLTSSCYGVGIGSPNKEQAIRMAKFMASAAGQIENAYMGFAASSNPSLDFLYGTTPVWAGKNYKAVAETADYGKLAAVGVTRNWAEALREVEKARDLVLTGKQSAKDAMTAAASAIEKIIKK